MAMRTPGFEDGHLRRWLDHCTSLAVALLLAGCTAIEPGGKPEAPRLRMLSPAQYERQCQRFKREIVRRVPAGSFDVEASEGLTLTVLTHGEGPAYQAVISPTGVVQGRVFDWLDRYEPPQAPMRVGAGRGPASAALATVTNRSARWPAQPTVGGHGWSPDSVLVLEYRQGDVAKIHCVTGVERFSVSSDVETLDGLAGLIEGAEQVLKVTGFSHPPKAQASDRWDRWSRVRTARFCRGRRDFTAGLRTGIWRGAAPDPVPDGSIRFSSYRSGGPAYQVTLPLDGQTAARGWATGAIGPGYEDHVLREGSHEVFAPVSDTSFVSDLLADDGLWAPYSRKELRYTTWRDGPPSSFVVEYQQGDRHTITCAIGSPAALVGRHARGRARDWQSLLRAFQSVERLPGLELIRALSEERTAVDQARQKARVARRAKANR